MWPSYFLNKADAGATMFIRCMLGLSLPAVNSSPPLYWLGRSGRLSSLKGVWCSNAQSLWYSLANYRDA